MEGLDFFHSYGQVLICHSDGMIFLFTGMVELHFLNQWKGFVFYCDGRDFFAAIQGDFFTVMERFLFFHNDNTTKYFNRDCRVFSTAMEGFLFYTAMLGFCFSQRWKDFAVMEQLCSSLNVFFSDTTVFCKIRTSAFCAVLKCFF